MQKQEATLRELDEKRARIESQLGQAAEDVTRAESAVVEAEKLESLALLGDAKAQDAERARSDADKVLEDARRRKRTAEGALAELKGRLEEASRALAYAQRDAAGVAYREALRKRNEATQTAAEALVAAVDRVRELARFRDAADEAGGRAKETSDALGEEPPEFPELDEPDFLPDGWQWFVEVLQQGPRQPLATAAEQRREREEARRRSEEAMLRQVENAGGIYIGGFPDRLRPEAERRLELVRQRREAEREAIRRLNGRGEEPTDPAIQAELERHPVAS
jgi:hypothetical protein